MEAPSPGLIASAAAFALSTFAADAIPDAESKYLATPTEATPMHMKRIDVVPPSPNLTGDICCLVEADYSDIEDPKLTIGDDAGVVRLVLCLLGLARLINMTARAVIAD